MNKRRLLKLADLLEADAKNPKGVKFDLTNWGDISDPTKPVSCGTTACAMGLAVASGAFKSAGLGAYYKDGNLCPVHNGRPWFGAAESLFGIEGADAEFLFSPGNYLRHKIKGEAGELFVAKRIRDFVAGKVSRLTR